MENWLLQMQSSMRLTMKDQMKKSLEQYPQIPRKEWALNWPGQVVLNVSMLYWTREVEECMEQKGLNGLKEYLKILHDQISVIVEMVRGKMTKQQRTLIRALCTLDVHAMNSIKDMIRKKILRTQMRLNGMSQL